MQRTIRDFPLAEPLWPRVETWAAQQHYRLVDSQDSRRVYQRGHGILVAPMMLSLETRPGGVHLEAWVRGQLLARLISLFILPAEMGIESGGFRGVVPRKIARTAVNPLLVSLGQPPIQ